MNRKLFVAYVRLAIALLWFPLLMALSGYLTQDPFTKGFLYGGGWIGFADMIFQSIKILRED